MFTGIVAAMGSVTHVQMRNGVLDLHVMFPPAILDGLQLGASLSVNGTCLTVVEILEQNVRFDVIEETLRRTNLGQLSTGHWVNVERSATFNTEIGGHILSGHIVDTVSIVHTTEHGESTEVHFSTDPSWLKYLFPKGYVALDGVSLTLVEVDRLQSTFSVHLIPETKRKTTLGDLSIGKRVNLEIDAQTRAIVDTVDHYLEQHFTSLTR